MSEEELLEAYGEESGEAGAEAGEEEAGEYENIDLNAALLEVMVKRTELLEQLASGKLGAEAAAEQLEAVKMPSLERRRRRR